MLFKFCKIVYPGDTHTYDSRYLTPEEFANLQESTEFVLDFLKRKDKRPELVPGLEATAAKLKELL